MCYSIVSGLQFKICLDIHKAQETRTSVVSPVLLLIGIEKKIWLMSFFPNRND